MFRSFREIAESMQGVQAALQKLHATVEGTAPAASRIEALEGRLHSLETSMEKIVAEAEAWYLRADAKHRLTRNAEQRAHDKLRKIESLEGDEDGDPDRDATLARMEREYAGNGPAEGMPAVREAVGSVSPKEFARALKFGPGR